jgi:hypothetical protein
MDSYTTLLQAAQAWLDERRTNPNALYEDRALGDCADTLAEAVRSLYAQEGPPRYCPNCYGPVYTGWLRCECGQAVDRTLSARDALDALRKRHAPYRRAVKSACWMIGPVIGERLPQQGRADAREMRETLERVYRVCKDVEAA